MVARLTVRRNLKVSKSWPKKGDVFYFETSNGRYRFGQVVSDKKSIGPFKSALILCIFSGSSEKIPESIEFKDESLLTSPIISDNSCWRNGIFATLGASPVDEAEVEKFLFVNPLNNKMFNIEDKLYEGKRDHMIVGERALWFCDEIVRKIESLL